MNFIIKFILDRCSLTTLSNLQSQLASYVHKRFLVDKEISKEKADIEMSLFLEKNPELKKELDYSPLGAYSFGTNEIYRSNFISLKELRKASKKT